MREFLLSLGVLLGIVAPQADPVLGGRLYRDATQIYLTAEVRDCLGSDALALVAAGDTLRLILDYHVSGLPVRMCAHEISYDPISRVYKVALSETRSEHRTADKAAAADIFSRFYGVRLAPATELGMPLKAELSARLVVATNPALDSGGLWNYHQPRVSLTVSSLTEMAW